MIPSEKVCCACKQTKPIREFYKKDNHKYGYDCYCKPCARAKRIASHKPENTRRNILRYRFGLTPEQYNEMALKQNNCCAICGKHQMELKGRLAIDHDHHTGAIRGLLCRLCNYGIGALKDSAANMQKAYEYLDKDYSQSPKIPRSREKRNNLCHE